VCIVHKEKIMRKIKSLLIPVFILVLLVTFIGSAQAAIPAEGVSTVLRGGGYIQEDNPPIANAGTDQSVDTLSPVTLDGSGSSDYPGEDDYPLTYQWTQTGGTTVVLTGATTMTPSFTAPDDPSVLTFSLVVTDSTTMVSDPDYVTITVNNQAPVSFAGMDQGVKPSSVVTLDGSGSSDPDNDYPLSYLWAQTGGTPVTLSNTTTVAPTFVAPAVTGTLTFELMVTDSLGLPDPSADEVIITVNNPPISDAGDDQSVNTLVTVTLDGSGSSDPDGNTPLEYWWEQTGGTTVTLLSPADAKPTFTAPGDPTTLTFSLMVTDSLGMWSEVNDSVTITVNNQAPTANAGTDQNVYKNTTVTLHGSGTDPDADTPLTYSWTQTSGPGVTLNNPAAQEPTFTAPAVVGTLTFSLVVTDSKGGVSAPDTVNVIVQNHAPVAVNDAYSTIEDTQLVINAPGVLTNDSDADGDPLTAVLVSDVTHGTLTLSPNGSFTYMPDANYAGADSFTYRASDGMDTSNLATVSITITPVNDAPVAVNDSYSTAENTTLEVNAPGVLGNDTDVDGDTLTAVWAEDPTHGDLTLNANGSFTYTPDTGYSGTDSFNYKAYDGTTQSAPATVTINVSEVNFPPVANPQSVTTNEDTAKAITLTGTDADGDPLTYSVVTPPSHGTLSGTAPNLTYTPVTNYNGSDSFTFKVNDETADSNTATVSITITSVNDAPVANAQSVTTDEDTAKAITLTGSDVDGDDLDFIVMADPSYGTLSGTAPVLTYTPDPGFNGPDSFTFKVNDGSIDSNAATVSITVILDEPLLTYLPLVMRSPEFGIPPAPFNKISPFDGAIYQLPTPTLSWAATKQVTHYEYCYDKTNDGACAAWINAGIATSVTLPTLSLNTTYYWQVRAWNGTVGPVYADGGVIEFWSFTTSPIYPPPNTILNGGFELGDRDWTEFSSHGYDLIMDNSTPLPYQPHSGSWLAWLGGVTDEISSVSQTIVIPVGRSILHYWYASGSTYACNKDYFKVYAGSDVLFTQTICEDTMTGSWVHKTLDLTPYAGSIKTLKFELSTSNSTWSNLVVDDISLEATSALSPDMAVDAFIIDPFLLELKKED
jgi:VCBS repeat-containing protein